MFIYVYICLYIFLYEKFFTGLRYILLEYNKKWGVSLKKI